MGVDHFLGQAALDQGGGGGPGAFKGQGQVGAGRADIVGIAVDFQAETRRAAVNDLVDVVEHGVAVGGQLRARRHEMQTPAGNRRGDLVGAGGRGDRRRAR